MKLGTIDIAYKYSTITGTGIVHDDEVGEKAYEISPLVTPTIKEENILHNAKGDSFHTKSNNLQGMIDRLVRNRENISEGEWN